MRQLRAVEVLRHQLVVVLDRRLDRLVARRLDGFLVLVRHVHDLERLAEARLVEDVLLALDDVDVAREQLARADRELQRERALGSADP